MAGFIEHLFVKPARRKAMMPVTEVQAVAGKGLEGDAAYGVAQRQVLLVEAEVLDRFRLQPGDTRENVVVRGLRMAPLAEGSRLTIGAAVLEVAGGCVPCGHMDELRPGLQEAIRGERGILARVVQGGRIRLGDVVAVDAGHPATECD